MLLRPAPSSARAFRPARLTQVTVAAVIGLAAVTVLLHVALLPAGHWSADEYFMLDSYRRQGVAYFLARLHTWSPRPVSETLIWLYLTAVRAAGRPLLTPCLALAWAALLVLPALAFCRRGPGFGWSLLIAVLCPAAFLLAHVPAEAFYWPAAALAYLPTLAGLATAALLLLRGLDGPAARRRRAGFAAALLLAAGSTEAGAMAVLPITLLLGAEELYSGRRAPRLHWLLPLAGAASVLAVLVASRAGAGVEAWEPTAHQLWPSLATTARSSLTLLLAPNLPPNLPPDASGWWQVPLFLGVLCVWRVCGLVAARPAQSVAFALGLMAGNALTLFSANWQFGVPCCPRHATLRADLWVLALLLLAAAAARRVPVPVAARLPAWAGPALLLAALTPPLLNRLPAWWADWATLPQVARIRAAHWAALRAPGDTLLWDAFPLPLVTNDANFLPGHYPRDGQPFYVPSLLDLAGKHTLIVSAPAE